MSSRPALFLKRWLKDPRGIGAIAPSSRRLGAAMAALIPPTSTGPVIELGGGTGAITRAILEAGIAPGRLIVVERDPNLHQTLCEAFPTVRTVKGDATALRWLLRKFGIMHASAVVSGLPLLNMPKSARRSIVDESFALLEPGAPFIQFTYGMASPIPRHEFGVSGEVKRRILNNLPPASVWVYRRMIQLDRAVSSGKK
ncbi:MAG: class I SAM-dependent methyltransferase [Dongiaceae bacterium]